jgi:hypothetical protein
MSYSRNYHETITVSGSKSKSVSYPKSDSGGTMTVTVNYTENVPVDIRINVDTNPFDQSIGSANRHINMLTSSVIATEAAHIAAKVQTSEAISNTIVDGFFGLIKSEINQQLTEIKPRVEALYIELSQHQQTCAEKKIQLENDFSRISERYAKIFNDLDKELRNRVLSLNQSTVRVHGTLTTRVHRSFSDISTSIATIFNKEGSHLQSILYASGLKHKALLLIESAKRYLFSEKNLSAQLQEILIPVGIKSVGTINIPVLYVECKNQDNGNNSYVLSPFQISALVSNEKKLMHHFSNSDSKWQTLNSKGREQINNFLKQELSQQSSEIGSVNARVAQNIMQLWNNDNNIQTNY